MHPPEVIYVGSALPTLAPAKSPNFTVHPVYATRRITPITVQSPKQRRRRLTIANTLERKRKGYPNDPPYAWAIVRDVITAHPAHDTSEYVAVLCEGIGEHAGQWFVWRTYFTNNRHGRLTFGQFGPQAPIAIDKWISDQIAIRGWYDKVLQTV